MIEIIRFFAGKNRLFRIDPGAIFDIEEACDKVGIAAIYTRLATNHYTAKEVSAVVKLAMICGGENPVEADQLVRDRMAGEMLFLHTLAVDLILKVWDNVQDDELSAPSDPEQPHDVAAIMHSFMQAGISPEQVRRMPYADLVGILRVAAGKDVQPPSETEFLEMVEQFEAKNG